MFRYIGRHWRGELSLPRSYWVNGFLVNVPLNIYFRVIDSWLGARALESPTVYLFYILVPYLLWLPVLVWQGVGIWRSAGRRLEEDGSGWAWVARAIVLLNAAVIAFSVAGSAQNYYSVVRAYMDERASTFSVESRGSYVIFRGTITTEAAEKLAPLLEARTTQRLVIDGSNGGFIEPALRLAAIIDRRKLWVVAIRSCYSSCTGLLAAGHIRAIAPDTVMGFHIGTIIGTDTTAQEWDGIESYYRTDGMTQTMFDNVHAHRGPTDFYYPTISDLIDNGLVNQLYDPEVKHYVPAAYWCSHRAALCARSTLENAKAEKHR